MTARSPQAADESRRARTRGQIVRRRITVVASLALVLGVVTGAVLAFYIGNRALIAKDSLQAAQGRLATFQSALGRPGAPSTAAMYRSLQADTSKAAKQVDDPVWISLEGLPYVGPNLKAFRLTAQLVDALVHDGVGPLATAADGISVESLKPKDGGLDIEPLKALTPAVVKVDDAMRAADVSAARIDTSDVVPQLKEPITGLRRTIGDVLPVTAELRKVMPVLYPALGGEGKRHYILLFQNNAEERASGGTPSSAAELIVDHGRLKLGKQPNSNTFPLYPEGVLHPGGDWEKLYGVIVSRRINQSTFTPDFPTTAKIARNIWLRTLGGKVDGVISFDPVALSYLLRATGPIELVNGRKLTADNAVPYLLSGVYAQYTDPRTQDAVFASAAASIFKAITSGQGDPKAYVAQLDPMLKEQRLKMWSVRKDEEALLMTSPLGTMLPEDNSKATVLGVYNNEDSTSKMSYWLDDRIAVEVDRCSATPKYTVTAKVKDILKPSQVSSLTSYVLAAQSGIVPGGSRQWINLFGPVGSKLVGVTVDGVDVKWGTNLRAAENTVPDATGAEDRHPAVKGDIYGRPMGVVNITLEPLQTRTIKAVFTGGSDPTTPVQVSHTPRVRPVPTTITAKTCG